MLYPARFLSSGRRVAVGLVVVLVAASGVAACGSNKASEDSTASPLEDSAPADAGAEASDGSSAEAPADAGASAAATGLTRSEEHTSELQSR